MKDDAVYLAQIRDTLSKIELFVGTSSEQEFQTDQKTQSAVILPLALIGELAKRVSDETRGRIDLPWKEIAGFRDRIIHDYYNIDVAIVWKTITDDVPVLRAALSAS